nr:PliI family lysozyme inhibitor of I-type lysozyme [Clostridium botulinum]
MTFRKKDNKNIGGIIILKRYGDTWKEILKEFGKNKIIYEVTFADIDGDNTDELLVGYSTGILEKNKLNIYKYDEKNKF